MEAIAIGLEAIAIRLEAIALGLEAIAIGMEAITVRLEAIATRLEAVALRLEAIATIVSMKMSQEASQSLAKRHILPKHPSQTTGNPLLACHRDDTDPPSSAECPSVKTLQRN